MTANLLIALGVALVVGCVAGLAGPLWAGLLLGLVLIGVGYVAHTYDRPVGG